MGSTFTVINPATEQPIRDVHSSSVEEVDAVIAKADKAFETWRNVAPGDRAKLLRRFAAVVVTNYLHRPLMPDLLAAIEPGGVLLYQTFMVGNERFGKPSRPEFLLKDGELLDLVPIEIEEHAPVDVRQGLGQRQLGLMQQPP